MKATVEIRMVKMKAVLELKAMRQMKGTVNKSEMNGTIAVHIISFCVSFLSQVDELNKLAGLHCMGLHSSAGRALQRERRGHGFRNPFEAPKNFFFGLFRNCLNCDSTAMVTFISFVFPQFTSFHSG